MSVSAGFEPDAIHRRIDFGHTDNLSDLIGQRRVLLQIDRHAAKTRCLF